MLGGTDPVGVDGLDVPRIRLTLPAGHETCCHRGAFVDDALRHRGLFPLDVNRAARELLLRVPGFGTRTVERILAARRGRTLRYEDLVRMGALMRKARPFIALPGWSPRALTDSADLRARFAPPLEQLRLL